MSCGGLSPGLMSWPATLGEADRASVLRKKHKTKIQKPFPLCLAVHKLIHVGDAQLILSLVQKVQCAVCILPAQQDFSLQATEASITSQGIVMAKN